MSQVDTETSALIRRFYIEDRLSQRQVAIKLGRSQCWLQSRLKALDLPVRNNALSKRHFEVNENYFETIDTHAKAYVLGFLFADGCVSEPRSDQCFSKRLQITLQESDIEVLEFIAKEMGYTGQIKRVKRMERTYCHLTIPSNTICNDLIRQGCHPRKSLTVKWPSADQVPEALQSSFVCGLFDGDGCFSISNRGQITPVLDTSIVVSYDMGIKLKELLCTKLNLSLGLSSAKPKETDPYRCVWRLRVHGNPSALKFAQWIYEQSPFYYKRKHDKFIQIRRLYDDNLKFIRTDKWVNNRRTKLQIAATGRVFSDESCLKISLKTKGRLRLNGTFAKASANHS